jgi:electron transfer flavoprotein alpha/beta subunit
MSDIFIGGALAALAFAIFLGGVYEVSSQGHRNVQQITERGALDAPGRGLPDVIAAVPEQRTPRVSHVQDIRRAGKRPTRRG